MAERIRVSVDRIGKGSEALEVLELHLLPEVHWQVEHTQRGSTILIFRPTDYDLDAVIAGAKAGLDRRYASVDAPTPAEIDAAAESEG